MATRLYLKSTRTHPHALRAIPGTPEYRDANPTQGTVKSAAALITASGSNQRQYGANGNLMAWWSERVSAPVTLSGTVNFHAWAGTGGAADHRLRMQLSKITTGGSDVETVLARADATTDTAAAATSHSFSFTLPVSVDIAVNERFVIRAFLFTVSGGTLTNVPQFDFAAGTGVDGDSWVELPQTVTFKPNQTVLSFRRTTVNAIGNFMDLLPTYGVSAFASAIVNTAASGTEIVVTKTAGGITAEWISPRFVSQWDLPLLTADAINAYGLQLAAKESAAAANVGARTKAFIRTPAGVESLLMTWDYTTELTTTMANYNAPMSAYTVRNAGEDDRLVVRFYIINVGVMGGAQTATFGYDGPAATTGTPVMTAYDLPDFKAESDPPKSDIVPSGQATLGLSNGQ